MTSSASDVAWAPDPEFVARANWQRLLRQEGLSGYAELERRAAADPDWFWGALLRFFDVPFREPWVTLRDTGRGKPWVRWCVGGTTNMVLAGLDRHAYGPRSGHPAVLWSGEDGTERRWTFGELGNEVARLTEALRALGIGPGSPVGLYMPMLPETAAAFLAVVKLGGIVVPLFSGFGASAIADRLSAAGAVAVVTSDGSLRRGRPTDMKGEIDEAAKGVPTLQQVVVLRRLGNPVSMRLGRDYWWHDLVAGRPATAPAEIVPADTPMMLAYTSGTTGRPKGTVHTHVGFLVKVLLDHALGFDAKPEDRLLWMTDIGWLVGANQIVAASALGATLVMAEGTPDYPEPDRLWRLIERHRVSFLGLAPTVARLMMQAGDAALERRDLSSLRVVASTGEPWDEASWRWVFDRVLHRRGPLLNYAGGTEMGGILGTNVFFPIKPASFNRPLPGTGADIVNEDGRPVPDGAVGELVMREPTMGLTQGLWNEPERYIESYWARFPGVWVHGDWASRDAEGHWYIHGRSDDTIKVAGKRVGPAEIEAVLLATGLVAAAAAVGVPHPVKGTAIACVVVPAAGRPAGEDLAPALAEAVSRGLGGAYRPQRVVTVPELPRTRNMKVVRRAVRAALTGDDPGDLSTLANPEALDMIRTATEGAS
jgi:acetyl-CoA synthetase